MGFRVLLSVLVLSSCLILNASGNGDQDESLIWTRAPAHAPSYPPMKAPAPHHHRHNGSGGHHHHKPAPPPVAHPPSKAPVHAPTKAPVHAPTKAPVQPPSHSPAPVHAPLPARRLVAVQGMVYCKACKYKGILTLLGATPLQGAVVLLTCNNSRYPLKVKGTTDKNGYFFIMPPKTLTTYATHTCRVTLLTSPKVTCSQPTNLNYGLKGAVLVPTKKPGVTTPVAKPLPYDVFTVGPFAFDAPPKTPCKKL